MLKVGQKAEVEITGYSSDGLGVCRIDGCAVFVPNAIRGERCEISVIHVSRNSAHGKIERILERSPHRIARACPVAKLCGGCQYHHMDYAEELFAKAQKVTDALNRIGGQSLPPVPITGGDGLRRLCEAAENREQRTGNGGPGEGNEPACRDGTLPSALPRSDALPVTSHQSPGVPACSGAQCAPQFPRSDASPVTSRQAPGVPACSGAQCAPQLPRSDASPVTSRQAPGVPACRDGTLPSALPLQSGAVPEAVYAYRNKAQYPVSEKNGRPIAGFYKSRTHELIPVERCAILPERFDRVKDVVLRWAAEDGVSVYDERSGKGLLRHIYVRQGTDSGELMVCLVVNGESLPREKRLIHALRREIPGLASVVLSENTKNTNVVLGDKLRTLWGRDWIEDELCGFRFRLSPRSFYQVNHDQAQRLYEKAVELAELHGTETVLDLYCGTGTITLALSRAAGKAVGVEIVPQAIEDAKENARRNGVENVEFFCADASVAAERLCAEGAAPDVIVVDPPRKGLAPDVIDAMVQMSPARIVYVSCDPATLARDVKLLSEKGYTLTHAEAFDLFPRTYHVETVVQLVRKNPDMTVSVTLNLEDADLTASEAKATYDQIKAYVLETFGLRVTSLQIAQTKRKLGLPTGEHYNLSQKENQVIPNCPPEKESAIQEALRHFRMI